MTAIWWYGRRRPLESEFLLLQEADDQHSSFSILSLIMSSSSNITRHLYITEHQIFPPDSSNKIARRFFHPPKYPSFRFSRTTSNDSSTNVSIDASWRDDATRRPRFAFPQGKTRAVKSARTLLLHLSHIHAETFDWREKCAFLRSRAVILWFCVVENIPTVVVGLLDDPRRVAFVRVSEHVRDRRIDSWKINFAIIFKIIFSVPRAYHHSLQYLKSGRGNDLVDSSFIFFTPPSSVSPIPRRLFIRPIRYDSLHRLTASLAIKSEK